MDRLALVTSALAAIVVCALLGLCAARVRSLMGRELDQPGADVTLASASAPVLLEADLLEGDFLTFELCASDAMAPAQWGDALTLRLEAGASEPRETVLDETIDAAMLSGARRGTRGACLDFARAGPLQVAGHYVVVVARSDPRLDGVAVRARVVAERPLGAGDRRFVLGILLGALAFVIGLALRPPATSPDASPPAWSRAASVGIAAAVGLAGLALIGLEPQASLVFRAVASALLLAVTVACALALRRGMAAGAAIVGVLAIVELSLTLSHVTPPGPAFGLLAGLALAASEIGIAAWLATRLSPSAGAAMLGLQRPRGRIAPWAAFAAAPLVGLLLRIAAMSVLSLVPSTGEAPIEAYVSWPSGLLSFAALSTVAPIGEEIFFRGLVYGALRGQGGAGRQALAFAGAWGLFVVAHLPQTWGSWGGLMAVAIAGLGFTTLRALTGSVLVAALAHLVYNGSLAVAALAT